MNPWLVEHRNEVFLATKTRERSGEAARAGLEDSLQRLGVDQVDLIQLHNLVEEDEWQEAFSPGGAVEALAAARDEGLVRFIGVTGHGLRIPGMHLRSLDEFAFDSVLFPFNYSLLRSDAFSTDVEQLISRCVESGIAIQTIKSVAKSRWESGYDGPKFSWYEPLREAEAIERAVKFVLGREHVFLNSTSDAQVLPMVLDAAGRATVGDLPTDAEMEHDCEQFEISPLFDGADLERI
jgi:aryl-alcohol dehydrogenase-like predicted oxidoreductase